jgi:hypothetical protein
MSRLQKYPQFANITFLGKVGETLRQAVGETATSDLPEEIRLLLRRLERMERRQADRQQRPTRHRLQGAE